MTGWRIGYTAGPAAIKAMAEDPGPVDVEPELDRADRGDRGAGPR